MEILTERGSNKHQNGELVLESKIESILDLHTFMIQLIARGDSLSDVLRALAEKLEGHFQWKTYCSILLTDKAGSLVLAHAPTLPLEYQKMLHLIKTGPKVGSCGAAVYCKKTVISCDIEKDSLWDDIRQEALRYGLKACWSIPILIDSRVVGTFAVYHSEVCAPSAHEIDMLETCASLAGLAIEREQRIKLEQQLQAAHKEMKHLFKNHQGMIFKYRKENGQFIHFFGDGQLIEKIGLNTKECIGKSLSELMSPEIAAQKEMYYEQAWNGHETSYEGELNGVHYIATMNPIFRNGKVTEVIVSCNDITELKKTHEELRETQELLESLVNNTGDAIATMNASGQVTYVNPAYVELFGWQEHEILNQKVRTVPDQNKAEFERLCQSTFSDKKINTFETERIKKDGSVIPVSITPSPLKNKSGLVTGTSVIIRDITEQKRIKQELEENKQRYESLFFFNPDLVYSMDVDGVIMKANISIQNTLGYTLDEVKGKGYETFIEKQFCTETSGYFKKALQGTPQNYETAAIHKNGQRVFLQVTNVPIVVNKQIVGVHGIAKDITERKKSQQEMLRLKQKLELVLDSIGDGIYVLNGNREIKLINSAGAKMLGYEVQELQGKTPQDTFRCFYELEACLPYQTLLDGNIRYAADELFLKKDGTSFPAEYVASPIWENGTISGVVVAFRDISKKKMSEEYLLKSAKLEMAGQLAAGVAHEIRNPLTSIQGFIQLLEAGMNKPEYFEIMRSEFERIEDIIGEFLALAKPQAITFQKNDMGSLLQQTIQLMNAQAIMQGVEVISEIEQDLPLVECDKHQLKQVFINIIKNAIEATHYEGQLLVSCKKSHSQLHIMFQDQGVGIPEERIKHLFEPFYSTKEKGTGLGLMISYKIIEEHQGMVKVESEEGKGTTFHIYLPI